MKQRNMSTPMNQHDFIQVTLIANLITVADYALKREKPGSKIRTKLSTIKAMANDIERKEITGYLDINSQAVKYSERFYDEMSNAINKFLRCFEDGKVTVGRDAKGRWCRI